MRKGLFVLILLLMAVCPAKAAEPYPARVVQERIESLRDNPDEEEIKEVRALYESLSLAEKVQVQNIGKLAEAEERSIENKSVNTEAPDTELEKKGNSYTVCLTKLMPQVTLKIAFDELSWFSITAPDGAVTKVSGNESFSVPGIICTRSVHALRLDMKEAAEGIWTVKTDREVSFTLSEYEEIKESDTVGQNEYMNTIRPRDAFLKDLGIIGGVAILCSFIWLGGYLLKRRISGKGNAKKYDELPEQMQHTTSDEEFAQLVLERRASEKKYLDEDDEDSEVLSPPRYDNRMFFTQYDIGNGLDPDD